MKYLPLSILIIFSFDLTGQTLPNKYCKTTNHSLTFFPKNAVVKIIFKHIIYLSDTTTIFKYACSDLTNVLRDTKNKTKSDTLRFYAPTYTLTDSLKELYIDIDDLINDLVENDKVLIYSQNTRHRVYKLRKTECFKGAYHFQRSYLLVDNLTTDTLISTFQTKYSYIPFVTK